MATTQDTTVKGKQRRLLAKEKEQVCVRYLGGETTTVLASDFKISAVAICGILKRRSIDRRPQTVCQRKCHLNESAFDQITPDSAYWAGFLFADGTIIRRRTTPEIALVLMATDKAHIEQFRDFLGSTHKITIVHRMNTTFGESHMRRFCVSSDRLASRLRDFGLKPHLQSLAIEPLARSPDFWRGVVDGDGWIGDTVQANGQPCARLDLVGGAKLLAQFVAFVKHICPSAKSTVRPHKMIFRVGLSGGTAQSVIHALYQDSSTALQRKHNAALNILLRARGPKLQRLRRATALVEAGT